MHSEKHAAIRFLDWISPEAKDNIKANWLRPGLQKLLPKTAKGRKGSFDF